MAKLLEKNGAEMADALVSIATPLRKIMDDQEFSTAWKESTRKGVQTKMTDLLQIYTDIIPMLLGKKHLRDTLAILSVIEDKSVKELLEMNGTDLMCDVIDAFNKQLKPFFIRLGITVGEKQ